jgi:tRNA threonylcarbamoyladenosine biosynthesis protein TsaB
MHAGLVLNKYECYYMSLILSIETATKTCSVALHDNGAMIGSKESMAEKSHSRLLAPMIRDLFHEVNKKTTELYAVAVSQGPGSYTGLRIGTSTAKGICYALDIPLIAINTLLSMCFQANRVNENNYHLCPMLDARRMEVYTMITDKDLKIEKSTRAVIIDDQTFKKELDKYSILFFGEGMPKTRPVLEKHPNAFFLENIIPSASAIGNLAFEKYRKKNFENLETFEPFYLKDFVATVPRKLI